MNTKKIIKFITILVSMTLVSITHGNWDDRNPITYNGTVNFSTCGDDVTGITISGGGCSMSSDTSALCTNTLTPSNSSSPNSYKSYSISIGWTINNVPDPSGGTGATMSVPSSQSILVSLALSTDSSGRNTGASNVNTVYLGGCGTTDTGTDPTPTCSYISNYLVSYSDCNINSSWTQNGTATCVQTVSATPVTTVLQQASCPANATPPSTTPNTGQVSLLTPETFCDNTYADNDSFCDVRINVKGTGILGGRSVVGLFNNVVRNIKNETIVSPDRISGNTSGNALRFGAVNNTSTIRGSGVNYYFDIQRIKSVAPFYTNDGKISFDMPGAGGFTNITIGGINYNFKKPYIGNLGIDGGGDLQVGTDQTSLLTLTKLKNVPTSYDISNYIDSFNINDPVNYFVHTKENERDLTLSPKIDFLVNLTGENMQGDVFIQTSPYISYNYDGSNVKYQLSESVNPQDNAPIKSGSGVFIGVHVIGINQATGRLEITQDGQSDITDIALSGQRTQIKKNIQKYIMGRSPDGDIKAGVKYVSGNQNISDLGDGYNTLVVEDGNLTIDEDITNTIGIVVIRNDQSQTDIGNIYVDKDVELIKALIYADGGFLSSGYGSGDQIENYGDSQEREENLNRQLVMVGTLFTRNTIGGALGTDGKYILPGGKEIEAASVTNVDTVEMIQREICYNIPSSDAGVNVNIELNDDITNNRNHDWDRDWRNFDTNASVRMYNSDHGDDDDFCGDGDEHHDDDGDEHHDDIEYEESHHYNDDSESHCYNNVVRVDIDYNTPNNTQQRCEIIEVPVTNYTKAFTYDLNYIRRSNDGWDSEPQSSYNKGIKNAGFVIVYDPTILSLNIPGFTE